jgi:hypothetical protein
MGEDRGDRLGGGGEARQSDRRAQRDCSHRTHEPLPTGAARRSAEAMRPIDQGSDSISIKSVASIGQIVPARHARSRQSHTLKGFAILATARAQLRPRWRWLASSLGR